MSERPLGRALERAQERNAVQAEKDGLIAIEREKAVTALGAIVDDACLDMRDRLIAQGIPAQKINFTIDQPVRKSRIIYTGLFRGNRTEYYDDFDPTEFTAGEGWLLASQNYYSGYGETTQGIRQYIDISGKLVDLSFQSATYAMNAGGEAYVSKIFGPKDRGFNGNVSFMEFGEQKVTSLIEFRLINYLASQEPMKFDILN